MKPLNYLKSTLAALALAAVCPLSAQDGVELEPSPELSDASASALLGVSDGTSTGGLSSRALTLRHGEMGAEVLVSIHSSDVSADLADALLSDGLISEARHSTHPEYMRAWVPDASVGNLKSSLDGFVPGATMSYYSPPVANSAEGAKAILADKYHATGLIGSGIKVAILDVGFAGAPDLARGEDLGFETGSQPDGESSHGAAMYEVLKGVAPEAEYLAFELNADLDVYTATQQAMGWGADIIVCALSWFELPGQGLASDAARLATDNFVNWVGAAGNFGDGAYWEGFNPAITSINGEYYLSADSQVIDPDQPISDVENGELIELHFSYEIAASAPATLALELWAGDGEAMEKIAQADAASNVQKLAYLADGRQFFARIRMAELGSVEGLRMFAPGARLGHSVREGSIANPAALPRVFSVGAMNHEQYGEAGSLEAQSSTGGGVFGLVLDYAAPSGDMTSLSDQPFHGTSSAAANFAGLLALQLADPGLAADPLGNLQRIEFGDAAGDMVSTIVKALVDVHEPDNSIDTAAGIGNDSTTVTGRMLSPSSDTDVYRMLVDRNRGIRVTMDSVGIVELLDADGMLMETKIDADGGISHEQLINEEVFIRVRPESGQLNYAYSLDVELFDLPLQPVELISPVDGAGEVDVNPVMSWSESPFEGVSYVLEIGADERFEKVILRQELAGNITQAGGLEHNSAYFWRVTVIDGNGAEAVSAVAGFTTAEESKVIEPEEPADEGEVLSGGGGEETQAANISAGCTSGGSTGLMILALLAAASGVLVRRRSLRTRE